MTTYSTNKPDPEKQSGGDRYARQICFTPLAAGGQQQLAAGRALVCGCGALGSVIANTLVRAGVGMVRIVDRDFLELNNLQRQVLFDEQDVANGLPKAVAAARKLATVNSQVTIEPVVEDDLDGRPGRLQVHEEFRAEHAVADEQDPPTRIHDALLRLDE